MQRRPMDSMGHCAAKVRLHAYVGTAIRSLVPSSVGLETLVDVPSPKNSVDENSMLGNTAICEKPISAQA